MMRKKIKQNIIDMVIRRGKLHNPVTDTGGLVMGVVEEIGAEYDNREGLKTGDLIICNASAASIPLYIEEITGVNKAFNQLEAKGYAIIHSLIPIVKAPKDVPVDMLMFTFDQSGTLYRLHKLAEGKEKVPDRRQQHAYQPAVRICDKRYRRRKTARSPACWIRKLI